MWVLAASIAASACGQSDAPPPPSSTDGASTPPLAFRQCAVCHSAKVNAPPRIGPTLAGVYGGAAASNGNFAYSQALREANIVWTDETLDVFLSDPQGLVPGNRMAFVGEKDAAARQEIIAFLKSISETNGAP